MHFGPLTPQELYEQDRKVLAPRLPREERHHVEADELPNLDYTVTLGGKPLTTFDDFAGAVEQPVVVTEKRGEFVQRLADDAGVQLIPVD